MRSTTAEDIKGEGNDLFLRRNEEKRITASMKLHSRQPSSSIELQSAFSEDVKIILTDITNLGVDEGIALKWDVLHGASNIDYFKVLYQTHGAEGQVNGYFALDESLSPDARSYIVDSLKPTTTYNFKIEAITKSRKHVSSNSKNFTLVQSRLSSKYSKARSLSPPVILGIWEIPSDGPNLDIGLKWKIKANQQINGFKIHYNVVKDGYSNEAVHLPMEIIVPVGPMKSANANQTSRIFTHRVQHLSYSKEYEFRVCAFNEQQNSDQSNIVSIFKSDDGAESVVHIQDVSKTMLDGSGNLLSDSDHANHFNDIANGKRSSKYLIGNANSLYGGNNANHQTMLLYTSLAIAIVSLLLLLFTATLVLMLRHYRRRQRFRNIMPYGESLCSFESKHPCLASKKPYNSNCTECYCENLSTSTNKNILTMPKLFSFNRPSNNSRIISSTGTADANNNSVLMHRSHHQPLHQLNHLNNGDNSECGTYLNRCSGCHLLMDTLNHHSSRSDDPQLLTSCGSKGHQQMHGQSANSQQNGGVIIDANSSNHQLLGAYSQQSENFYHTLAETPNGETTIDTQNALQTPSSAPLSLKCQCCGQAATREEAFAYQQQHQEHQSNCCQHHHCCMCTGPLLDPSLVITPPYPPLPSGSTLRSRILTSSSSSGVGSAGVIGNPGCVNRSNQQKKVSPSRDECQELIKPLLDCRSLLCNNIDNDNSVSDIRTNNGMYCGTPNNNDPNHEVCDFDQNN
ncbi:hypothetical protein GJ496_001104 [Pomphorhynchus laevis]|nr:hypothetical protein GJ496_001104 [Pomphorhynchus laevis]